MLQLKNITKLYEVGNNKQTALNGVSVNFRENEFVSILGPSGSGKTTMLNIIGGLDRYTDGDLIINGTSTKKYQDADWDTYRNHSIGFVFQSYNLIPHQTVLSNVELALTLAGVSKTERRELAIQVLEKVGLKDHIHKKPTQMSGGQMQRVAIARALINNPDILLADEPTGALDSETSVQIMGLLKEIAKDKLVIMVTHNPELAEQYSTRIIRVLDGKIKDDSDPYDDFDVVPTKEKKGKKVSMSFITALSLSFNNLKTKKGRTSLTALAGSIGIIGIALILSLSSGMEAYIANVEKDTLSSYPVSIQSQTIDVGEVRNSRLEMRNQENEDHSLDKVYQGGYASDTLKRTTAQMQNNNLEAFKSYLESDDGRVITDNANAIQYGYNLDLQLFKADTSNGIIQVNPNPALTDSSTPQNAMLQTAKASMGMGSDIWTELIGNEELLAAQYDVLAGTWPSAYNEVVLVLNENNEISDMTLYSLGLKDINEYEEISNKIKNGEEIDNSEYEQVSYTFDELLALEYKLVLNTDYYENVDGLWIDRSSDKEYMTELLENAIPIKVVGILRPNEDAGAASITGTVGYTHELTEYVIGEINNSDIVKAQQANTETDVFTGKEFSKTGEIDKEAVIVTLSDQEKAYFSSLSEEEQNTLLATRSQTSVASYDGNLERLGVVDLNKPSSINLYLKSFEAKETVVDAIENYNIEQIYAGKDDYTIEYTDMVAMITSSVSSIIDMITYLLIGFVSISLVVSSIMIGIITYISVLERTKEIGILRSIGASKKDISRVFNAETVIVGLFAGVLGIGITLLLNIPVNMIIEKLSGVSGIAVLPWAGAVALIAISAFLTVVAGLIPSKMAAKKDPVEALRSE